VTSFHLACEDGRSWDSVGGDPDDAGYNSRRRRCGIIMSDAYTMNVFEKGIPVYAPGKLTVAGVLNDEGPLTDSWAQLIYGNAAPVSDSCRFSCEEDSRRIERLGTRTHLGELKDRSVSVENKVIRRDRLPMASALNRYWPDSRHEGTVKFAFPPFMKSRSEPHWWVAVLKPFCPILNHWRPM
jgi:hypothetical protein